MWTCCTKLRFDGVMVSRDNINAILQQHSGKIVEEFEVKFEFDSKLVDHLNGLVDFAVSSQAKKVAFDLVQRPFFFSRMYSPVSINGIVVE